MIVREQEPLGNQLLSLFPLSFPSKISISGSMPTPAILFSVPFHHLGFSADQCQQDCRCTNVSAVKRKILHTFLQNARSFQEIVIKNANYELHLCKIDDEFSFAIIFHRNSSHIFQNGIIFWSYFQGFWEKKLLVEHWVSQCVGFPGKQCYSKDVSDITYCY